MWTLRSNTWTFFFVCLLSGVRSFTAVHPLYPLFRLIWFNELWPIETIYFRLANLLSILKLTHFFLLSGALHLLFRSCFRRYARLLVESYQREDMEKIGSNENLSLVTKMKRKKKNKKKGEFKLWKANVALYATLWVAEIDSYTKLPLSFHNLVDSSLPIYFGQTTNCNWNNSNLAKMFSSIFFFIFVQISRKRANKWEFSGLASV